MSARMAQSNRCSMCEKGLGTCYCTGCHGYFCVKDFRNHRAKLLEELDGFVEDRNDLQEKISSAHQHDDSLSPILTQIDAWQTITIEKVKQAAEQARQQVIKILRSNMAQIMASFAKFSDELIRLKDTEDFVEDNLVQLQEMIHHLRQDFQQLKEPSSIDLHLEQSDQIVWSHIIYAEDKCKYSGIKQDQTQPTSKFIN